MLFFLSATEGTLEFFLGVELAGWQEFAACMLYLFLPGSLSLIPTQGGRKDNY